MKPGSTVWLLAHELRLYWRGMGGKTRIWSLIVLGVLFVLLASAGLPLALLFRNIEVEITEPVILWTCAALLLVFSLMLSHTLAAATEAFFARGDLDLLLSSPIPATRVLGARCLALAAATSALWLFLVTPPVLTAAALGQPRLLAAPVIVSGLALMAAALGLWTAMGLFALIGPRRTRTASQILGAVIGAAFFLAFQSYSWLSDETQDAVGDRLERLAAAGAFEPDGVLAWPARALLGEPLPTAAFVGLSAAVFWLTATLLGRRFAANAAAANGREAGRMRATTGDAQAFSRGVVPATIKKELRLIARDPKLISQVLLRLLYMLPLVFLLLRADGDNAQATLATVAAGVTFLTGQLAGSLAWVTVSTEDAPDLLACSPARPATLRWAKLAAALIPVGVVVALPLAALAVMSPSAGMAAALTCAGAATSSGLIRLWHGKPAKRADFNKRENSGGILINLADALSSLTWGAAAYLGVRFGLWGLLPALAALALLAAMRRPAPAYAFS